MYTFQMKCVQGVQQKLTATVYRLKFLTWKVGKREKKVEHPIKQHERAAAALTLSVWRRSSTAAVVGGCGRHSIRYRVSFLFLSFNINDVQSTRRQRHLKRRSKKKTSATHISNDITTTSDLHVDSERRLCHFFGFDIRRLSADFQLGPLSSRTAKCARTTALLVGFVNGSSVVRKQVLLSSSS